MSGRAKRSGRALKHAGNALPTVLEDGQRVGQLMCERLIGWPARLYGAAIGLSYQRQGLSLSRHFRQLVTA